MTGIQQTSDVAVLFLIILNSLFLAVSRVEIPERIH